jgi:hypothetical protein
LPKLIHRFASTRLPIDRRLARCRRIERVPIAAASPAGVNDGNAKHSLAEGDAQERIDRHCSFRPHALLPWTLVAVDVDAAEASQYTPP